MPNPLEEILMRQIGRDGPMDVGAFMSVALGHPEHGYYMNRDPFGAAGDFVTAPEVSQLFGEMIGAWAADVWMQMGAPARFVLLECGPGRGTLMADVLRATKGVAGFAAAAQVCLLEMSPVLRGMQLKALEGVDVRHCDTLAGVPEGVPIIVIGNEFLDALSFRSLQKTRDGWCERIVAVNGDDGFEFALRPAGKEPTEGIPFHVRGAAVGSVYEIAPEREAFVAQVASRIEAQGGAGLFIDYGHRKSAAGDTFQAVKGNAYADVLRDVGEADLTSHVDFEALVQGVSGAVKVHGPVTQAAFLSALGIEIRAQKLLAGAASKQGADLQKGLHRLVSSGEMGTLFKVICLSADHEKSLEPCGF
jgi:NADH dehydrogenase [ubiquinone] 1 alpha subcomplex assembly factor 7